MSDPEGPPPETDQYSENEYAPEGDEHAEDYVEGAQDVQAAPAESPDQAAVAEGMLPNITLPVIVALGRSYMSIKEILKLRPGQILELNKNPNEPVDLVVNGKVVARGELVDVEGRLAIRLIKIVE